MKNIILFGVLTLCTSSVLAAKPEVSVSLEPKQIALGETAQLTVTVSGALGNEGTLPEVEGLEFKATGRSSLLRSINGEVTESQSLIYLVRPTRAGTFTIPALTVGRGRNAVSSAPVVLRVTGSGSTPVPDVRDDEPVSANGQMAFLRLVTPKREFYVGELVPVEIKAYVRAGVGATLNELPQLTSDAFTMNRLDGKPAQSQTIVDGQPYDLLSWTTALCAVKAGDYSLGLELPVLVRMQERSRTPRGFFDDSFFDDFFGRIVEKPLTLKSEPDAATVLTLPDEHRPADFSGAVGEFDVAAEASPSQIAAGDPITLRMKITGKGNFDRVSTSLLAGSSEWKTYKPVGRFEPADNVGYQGTKTLEQAVVPTQAGAREVPPLSFSYFDPQTRQYVTRRTTPIAVEVLQGATPPVVATPLPVTTPAIKEVQPELAPNQVEPGRFVSTLRPLCLRPWFLILNFLILAGLAVAFLSFRHREKLARDTRLVRGSQAGQTIRKHLTTMETAMRKSDSGEFFAAARRALQHRLAEKWDLPPETITLAEIKARLNGDAGDLRRVFEMADRVTYSRESIASADLAHWQTIVTKELERLK